MSAQSSLQVSSTGTEEFSFLTDRDSDVWSRPSRDDIEICTNAFNATKESLYFSSQEQIEETRSTVGPQEHLDHAIVDKVKEIERSVPLAGSGDEIPQKVLTIANQVVTMATEGQTSTFAAYQNTESTQPAYDYGRKAAQNRFDLSRRSREKLDMYDKAFTEFVDLRRVTDVESSENKLTQCYQYLDEAVIEAREDQSQLNQRIMEENVLVTMERLHELHESTHDELHEEKQEYNVIKENCHNDMVKIEKSLQDLHNVMDSTKKDYTKRAIKRQTELVNNRHKQDTLRKELKQLEEEEKELVSLTKEEKDLQDVADAEYSNTVSSIKDWKNQIGTLAQQAETSLLIMEQMRECTDLILNDAKMRKREWEQSLYHMQIENLLHLRDAIIANICIHKMISDDSSDNLTETEKIVGEKEMEKRKWSQRGFKERVLDLANDIEKYQTTKEKLQETIISHNDKIKELEHELIQIDDEIKSLKPDIPLDKANTRYEARRRMIQKIYEKDDASIANFCSHGQYRF